MEEIAIALGGGGMKGIAHIGALRTLEKAGYTIRAISGTSAGGIVGAIYAAGYTTEQIETMLTNVPQKHMFTRQEKDGPSLLGFKGLVDVLTEALGDRTFEDLPIPFACTAVDLISHQEIILSHGRVVDAVLATVAVPGIFPPQQIGETMLVDGGVLDPVPVKLARWLAPNLPIVAVVLSPVPEEWAHLPPFRVPSSSPIPAPVIYTMTRLRVGQAFKIFTDSMDITSHSLSELRLQVDKPDVIIRPNVYHYSMLDNVDPLDLIQQGEKATQQVLPQIAETLSWRQQIGRRFRKADLPGRMLPPEEQTAAAE